MVTKLNVSDLLAEFNQLYGTFEQARKKVKSLHDDLDTLVAKLIGNQPSDDEMLEVEVLTRQINQLTYCIKLVKFVLEQHAGSDAPLCNVSYSIIKRFLELMPAEIAYAYELDWELSPESKVVFSVINSARLIHKHRVKNTVRK